jgi:hypothetical protein
MLTGTHVSIGRERHVRAFFKHHHALSSFCALGSDDRSACARSHYDNIGVELEIAVMFTALVHLRAHGIPPFVTPISANASSFS